LFLPKSFTPLSIFSKISSKMKVFKIFSLASLVLLAGFIFINCKKQDNTQAMVSTPKLSYLALGDSYTIGESVPVSERYPEQLVIKLGDKDLIINNLRIIAKTGWTTDELSKAIDEAKIEDSTYNLVSLLIGVNNQYRGRSVADYKPQFRALLDRAIKYAGGRKDRVVVVSIPDWGQTPFGVSKADKVAQEIDAYNVANDSITRSLGIEYVNITPISREWSKDKALVASDDLHPSGKQYGRWVDLMLPKIEAMLKK
jgi:lysophospholipase L1-like esterase